MLSRMPNGPIICTVGHSAQARALGLAEIAGEPLGESCQIHRMILHIRRVTKLCEISRLCPDLALDTQVRHQPPHFFVVVDPATFV